MRRYKNTIFQIAPDLVKEWHPTANDKLNPRNLGVDYPKKVWWICNQSHEWQDTIKNRIQNKDCPICEKTGTVDYAPSIPLFRKQRREHERFNTNAIAALQIPESGYWTYARIKNFSRKGLCVETDFAINPGSEINLKFDKNQVTRGIDNFQESFNIDTFKTYKTIVKWYRILEAELPDSNVNIGLELS